MEEYVRQVNTNIELSQEIERLNNIIKPKKTDYDYIKNIVCYGLSRVEIIKFLAYKCEQLEKLCKSYEKLEIENYQINNIITELEKWLNQEIKDNNLDAYTLKQTKTRFDYLRWENTNRKDDK